jgi:flagellin
MGLRINQNVAAFNAYRNLNVSDSAMAKSLEKLSSGFRINRAADDAAGLVISEGLRSRVNGLAVATRNAQDGISVVQTAEGALTEVHSILQRMRDLALHAANSGSADANAVAADQQELDELVKEIDRIGSTTSFGATKLIDGSYAGKVFQVGPGTSTSEQITVTVATVSSSALTVGTLTLATAATTAVSNIDAAITAISSQRGKLGALQNRLEHTIANLSVTQENLAASESRVRDTDMAAEMTNYTKQQILVQAGTAMLAQANAAPQGVLQLLRG